MGLRYLRVMVVLTISWLTLAVLVGVLLFSCPLSVYNVTSMTIGSSNLLLFLLCCFEANLDLVSLLVSISDSPLFFSMI